MKRHSLVSALEEQIDLAGASKDRRHMDIVHMVLTEIFEDIVERDPAKASEILESICGRMEVNNYLSESQARQMVAALRGGEGERSARWPDPSTVFEACRRHDLHCEKRGFFNKYAYFFMVNTKALDHEDYIREIVGDDETELFKHAHQLACDSLTDFDHPYVIDDYL